MKSVLNRWRTDIFKTIAGITDRGIRNTWDKIQTRIRRSNSKRHIKKEVFRIPIVKTEPILPVSKRISVVIPTKNAGTAFTFLLEKIRRQAGFKTIEILIVDSGSTDDTLQIGKHFDAKILPIRPFSFNHGLARNRGADYATGDFLFFITQDALPASDTCMYQMIQAMERDIKIAAVSARQIPRSDADLFGCWQLWHYYHKVLEIKDDEVFQATPHEIDRMNGRQKRKIGQIDNVFCCIRKDLFDRYRFNPLPYAEDLDLGLRFLSDGFKLAFLSSVGVIHSHNRSPSYYFKRSYVDIKQILRLLNEKTIDWKKEGFRTPEMLLSHLYFFYLKMKCMDEILDSCPIHDPNEPVLKRFAERLNQNFIPNPAKLEESLDELFAAVFPEIRFPKSVDDSHWRLLYNQYMELFGSFIEFVSPHIILENRRKDLVSSLYKLFAVVAGSNIGNMEVYCSAREIQHLLFKNLDKECSIGI
ncbi:MAG: glycosyltransferase family 2 protein [Thermodesulfobacteriota bacterium]